MKNKENISNRSYIVYMGVFVFSIMVMYKMFSIQLSAEKKGFNFISTVSEVEIKASKGNVFANDAEKSALAISVPIYDLRMDVATVGKDLFNKDVDSLAYGLAKVFKDKTKTAYLNELKQARSAKKRYFLIKKNISYSQMKKVKVMPILRRGAYRGGRIIIKRNKRVHPFGMLAEITVGYFNEHSRKGLEGFFKEHIKGTNGLQYMKNVGGGQKIPVSEDYLVKPKNGMDIYTTIDVNIQDVAEKALLKQLKEQNAENGCAVLMEVKTGEIKAIANLGKNSKGKYREVKNFAVQPVTNPGSTFKLASVMVAMEDGKLSPNDLFDTKNGKMLYYDQVMRDDHVVEEKYIPLSKGFALSSNIVISQAINSAYKKNPEKFLTGLKKLGFGTDLGIDFIGEGKAKIRNVKDNGWSGISLPWMSIGYENEFTPLQILTFYNAVANNGKMVKPQFVREIKDGSKIIEEKGVEVIKNKICSEKTIKQAQKLLELVVEEGTGKNLKNANYKIAGKTGTTQLNYNTKNKNKKIKHQASFCGYFPADNPKYSCIVVVAAPTKSIYGNVVSGTVFKEIADKVYAMDEEMARNKSELVKNGQPVSKNGFADELNKIFKDLKVKTIVGNADAKWIKTTTQSKQVKTDKLVQASVPNVVGMGLKDAIYLLENKGFFVRIDGSGFVREQKVIEGRSKTIKLILS